MTVIAMTREMGSLGKDVALALGTELGLEVIHHELVERDLAERLDVGESDVHRFLEGQASLFERWKIDKTSQRYCSWWERSGWSCYDLYRDGDIIIWGTPGTSARYPSTLLEGKRL